MKDTMQVDMTPFEFDAAIKVIEQKAIHINRAESQMTQRRHHCDTVNGHGGRCRRRCVIAPSFMFCGNVDYTIGNASRKQLWRRGRRSGTGLALTLCVNADTACHKCEAVDACDNGRGEKEGAMCCRRRVTCKVQQRNTRRPRDGGWKGARAEMDVGGSGREMDANQVAQGTDHVHVDSTADVGTTGSHFPIQAIQLDTHSHLSHDGKLVFASTDVMPHAVGRATDGDGDLATKPHHPPSSSTRVPMHLSPAASRRCASREEGDAEKDAELRRSCADGRLWQKESRSKRAVVRDGLGRGVGDERNARLANDHADMNEPSVPPRRRLADATS